jgi:hypothetical protein
MSLSHLKIVEVIQQKAGKDPKEFSNIFASGNVSASVSFSKDFYFYQKEYELFRGIDTRDHKGQSSCHWPPILRVHGVGSASTDRFSSSADRAMMIRFLDGLAHQRGWYLAIQWGTHKDDPDSHAALSKFMRQSKEDERHPAVWVSVDLNKTEYLIRVFDGVIPTDEEDLD